MKKYSILFCIISLFVGYCFTPAFAATLFGPKQYMRGSGAPEDFTDVFAAVPGEGKIIVKNGKSEGSKRVDDDVSSATIVLNGDQIFGPNDFNKQVYSLEATVHLDENNSLDVELASDPGSYLTIEITAGAAPPSVNISADPASILIGGSTTLSWNVVNADTCMIEPDIGVVPLSGSQIVSPAKTTVYTITATGAEGTARNSHRNLSHTDHYY